MAINYFISENKDLTPIYKQLILWFKEKQYEVDSAENEHEYLIQARKTGTFRTLTGTNQAFKIKVSWSQNADNKNEFIVETSTGKWVSNLAGAGITAMFTGGITVLTGLAGAGWALVVEANIIDYIENTLKYKKIKNEIETQQFHNIQANANSTNIVQFEEKKENNSEMQNLSSPRSKAEAKVKEEVVKLEIAYKNEILTKDEFESKAKALKLKIERYEIDFAVEEKVSKLEKAFVQGILTEQEYEAKVVQVRDSVEKNILNQRFEEQKLSYIIKLRQAVENGILSESEYEAKIASYQPESIC